MNGGDGRAADRVGVLEELDLKEDVQSSSDAANSAPAAKLASRTKQRTRQQFQQNRFVIVAAGALVVALLVFVAVSVPHSGTAKKESPSEIRPHRGNKYRDSRQSCR